MLVSTEDLHPLLTSRRVFTSRSDKCCLTIMLHTYSQIVPVASSLSHVSALPASHWLISP